MSPYLSNQQFDESYALLSHYIQLQGNPEAMEYQKLLLEHGVDVDITINKVINKGIIK